MKQVRMLAGLVLFGAIIVIVYFALTREKVSAPAPEAAPPAPAEAPGATAPAAAPSAPTSGVEQVVVNLSAQNNSGEQGTAYLSAEGIKTRVQLQLTGFPGGTSQPAHIHTGSCTALGGVKYPLVSPTNGVSVTILDVSLATILAGRPLAINVHQSPQEAGSYVSCGNIPAR